MRTLLLPRTKEISAEPTPRWTEQVLRLSHRYFPAIAKMPAGSMVTMNVRGRIKTQGESYDDPKELQAEIVVLGAENVEKAKNVGRMYETEW